MTLMVDPALQLLLQTGLSLLFAVAAFHKAVDLADFSTSLDAYRLLPERWTRIAARSLVVFETCVAVGVWLSRLATAAAAALLTVYTIAIVINLMRGRRDIDCGCGGPGRKQTLSYKLVVRNAALIALATICAFPTAGRPLLWIDGLTVIAGVTVLSLLYGAGDSLLSNRLDRELHVHEVQHA